MATHIVAPIVAVLGLLIYMLPTGRAQEPGLYAFAAGLLVTLLQLPSWH